jgi:hypothetical protein
MPAMFHNGGGKHFFKLRNTLCRILRPPLFPLCTISVRYYALEVLCQTLNALLQLQDMCNKTTSIEVVVTSCALFD